MPEPIPDDALAQHLVKAGFATAEQLEAARALQAERERESVIIPLGEALVRAGVITPQQREIVEEKLKAGLAGEVQQLGQFKLLKKLGQGGMGAVYLAEDVMLSRKVALKVLPRQFSSDPERLARFKREARAAGWLNHVNIVTAFDIGEDLGNHFFVMEYCEGETLDARLDREKRLPEKAVAEIAIQVAQGLHYAHGHGIIHRDIKPGNIFLTLDGVAKVLDLGLSKDVAQGAQSFETLSGVVLGTPHYISPEQARGAKDVDNRSDIYSLGATMYHLVTGETPFHASDAAAVILMHMTKQLPDPREIRSEISEGMVHIITKAMAKAPEDRYDTMAEMGQDLEQVRDGQRPTSPPLDPTRSSVARRRAPSPPRTGERTEEAAPSPSRAAPPTPRDGEGDVRAGVGGTRELEAVGEQRMPGQDGTGGQARGGITRRTYLLIGGAAAGVLLLVGLILAFSGVGNPVKTTKAKSEEGKQPSSTQPTTPEQLAKATPVVQPGTLNPKPETGPWPLHDGKEPIADYARRVGLAATLALDLGGGVKVEFVLIPAGKFLMGSPETEKARGTNETQHEVTISKAFYMGKHEVTVGQFERFVEAAKYQTEAEKEGWAFAWDVTKWGKVNGASCRKPGFEQTDEHPVCEVSWNDSKAFCEWLSRTSGKTVRLPTEAEWEYAARGRTTTAYPWGDNPDDGKGWGNAADQTLNKQIPNDVFNWDDGYVFTAPVGRFCANAFGLYDTMGNVWEWCEDWYGECQAGAATDPKGPAAGALRLVRGGSWRYMPRDCRSAGRYGNSPVFRLNDIGFRVAVEATTAAKPPETAALPKDLPPEQQLAEYRKRIEAAWPVLGERLVLKDGRFELNLDGCKQVSDLAPLEGLPLSSFSLWFPDGGNVKELKPLTGMKLTLLSIAGNQAPDLAPLQGMPLTRLHLWGCGVRDLSPLRGMPLTWLNLDNNLITDLTPLKGLPLSYLNLKCNRQLKDLAPLDGMTLDYLELWCCEQVKDISPLAGLKKLTSLELGGTRVSDLMPLKGLPLTSLDLFNCGEVKDLKPLAGMRLRELGLQGTKVSDLTPLKGMPLTGLGLVASEALCDLTPLEGMSLEGFLLVNPNNITKGLDVVRNMKSLKTIAPDVNGWNRMPAADFWKKYDAGEFTGGVKPVPASPAPAGQAGTKVAEPQPTRAQPVKGIWPLHDGKEPIADYAKRVGLPATVTVALGGGVRMEFLLAPAGEFDMGEKGIAEPVHRVRISKPFYMAKYETTVAQFRAFANATKYRTEAETTGVGAILKDGGWVGVPGTSWRNPRFPQEDNYPACVMTWNDAQEFCKWVTRMTGREVCLPTDAQWEYACRAGTTTAYNTGDKESDLEEAAWTNTNSGMHNHPVGQRKANAWGLYDMHGNVWEWVQDYYSDKYYAESPLVDPKGPATGSLRVFRGCCWYETRAQCRSAHHGGFDPTHRFVTIGFRVAVGVPKTAPTP